MQSSVFPSLSQRLRVSSGTLLEGSPFSGSFRRVSHNEGSFCHRKGAYVYFALKSDSEVRVSPIPIPIPTSKDTLVASTQPKVSEEIFQDFDEVEGTTFWEAMLNAVNILLGVGLLSIPYALSEGGWCALGVLVLLGIATNYTGKLLGLCQERMCLLGKNPTLENPNSNQVLKGLESYEDIGEAAFGKIGRAIITFVLYVELVGTCGLFFILEGDNLSRLFGGDPSTFMFLSALVLVPTTWLADLSALAALGLLGALASSSVLLVVLYTFISEGFPVSTSQSLVEWGNLPFTFGLLSFVYAGHAVFPNIKASMRDPSEYPKMLDYTYLIVAGVCALVGIIGYLMYGHEVKQEIILNLPTGLVATLATGLIVVNPFTKFALTMEPVAKGFETAMFQESGANAKSFNFFTRLIVRTCLGALALFLATSVPAFANVMAVIGSCLTILVSIIFPSAAFLKLFGNSLQSSERYWNYVVISLGSICAVTGTYTAIISISNGVKVL